MLIKNILVGIFMNGLLLAPPRWLPGILPKDNGYEVHLRPISHGRRHFEIDGNIFAIDPNMAPQLLISPDTVPTVEQWKAMGLILWLYSLRLPQPPHEHLVDRPYGIRNIKRGTQELATALERIFEQNNPIYIEQIAFTANRNDNPTQEQVEAAFLCERNGSKRRPMFGCNIRLATNPNNHRTFANRHIQNIVRQLLIEQQVLQVFYQNGRVTIVFGAPDPSALMCIGALKKVPGIERFATCPGITQILELRDAELMERQLADTALRRLGRPLLLEIAEFIPPGLDMELFRQIAASQQIEWLQTTRKAGQMFKVQAFGYSLPQELNGIFPNRGVGIWFLIKIVFHTNPRIDPNLVETVKACRHLLMLQKHILDPLGQNQFGQNASVGAPLQRVSTSNREPRSNDNDYNNISAQVRECRILNLILEFICDDIGTPDAQNLHTFCFPIRITPNGDETPQARLVTRVGQLPKQIRDTSLKQQPTTRPPVLPAPNPVVEEAGVERMATPDEFKRMMTIYLLQEALRRKAGLYTLPQGVSLPSDHRETGYFTEKFKPNRTVKIPQCVGRYIQTQVDRGQLRAHDGPLLHLALRDLSRNCELQVELMEPINLQSLVIGEDTRQVLPKLTSYFRGNTAFPIKVSVNGRLAFSGLAKHALNRDQFQECLQLAARGFNSAGVPYSLVKRGAQFVQELYQSDEGVESGTEQEGSESGTEQEGSESGSDNSDVGRDEAGQATGNEPQNNNIDDEVHYDTDEDIMWPGPHPQSPAQGGTQGQVVQQPSPLVLMQGYGPMAFMVTMPSDTVPTPPGIYEPAQLMPIPQVGFAFLPTPPGLNLP